MHLPFAVPNSAEEFWKLSAHARQRMEERGIPEESVLTVLRYGRYRHVRNADFFLIGRREIGYYRAEGLDLSRLAGIHVVCGSDGTVITVYRNHDLGKTRHERSHRTQAFSSPTENQGNLLEFRRRPNRRKNKIYPWGK